MQPKELTLDNISKKINQLINVHGYMDSDDERKLEYIGKMLERLMSNKRSIVLHVGDTITFNGVEETVSYIWKEEIINFKSKNYQILFTQLNEILAGNVGMYKELFPITHINNIPIEEIHSVLSCRWGR